MHNGSPICKLFSNPRPYAYGDPRMHMAIPVCEITHMGIQDLISHICYSPNGYKHLMVTGSPQMRNISSPSPFPYGDSPYGYGDCVFGHPFSHALKNIFFAEASHAHRANISHFTIWGSYCNPRSIIVLLPFLDIRLQHE